MDMLLHIHDSKISEAHLYSPFGHCVKNDIKKWADKKVKETDAIIVGKKFVT